MRINCLFLCILLNMVKPETLYNFAITEGQTPFLVTKNESGTFFFYDNQPLSPPYKIQHHLPFLLQSLVKINTPIVHQVNLTKYEILPFKTIIMENKHGRTLLGKYVKSIYKDGAYSQVYDCGDTCDLNKKTRRSAKVTFKGVSGPLRVESIVEKKLCKYFFEVGGENLARNITENVNIGYKYVSHSNYNKNATEEDEDKEKMAEDLYNKKFNKKSMDDILRMLQDSNFDETEREKETL